MKEYLDDAQTQKLINLGLVEEEPILETIVDLHVLLDLLPKSLPNELCHLTVISDMDGLGWTACYEEEKTGFLIHGFYRTELIDALFDLLCWAIRREGYVTKKGRHLYTK